MRASRAHRNESRPVFDFVGFFEVEDEVFLLWFWSRVVVTQKIVVLPYIHRIFKTKTSPVYDVPFSFPTCLYR